MHVVSLTCLSLIVSYINFLSCHIWFSCVDNPCLICLLPTIDKKYFILVTLLLPVGGVLLHVSVNLCALPLGNNTGSGFWPYNSLKSRLYSLWSSRSGWQISSLILEIALGDDSTRLLKRVISKLLLWMEYWEKVDK